MPASPASSSPTGGGTVLTSSSALVGTKGVTHGAAAGRRSPPAAPSSPRRSERGSSRQSPVSSAAADFGGAAHQQQQQQQQQSQSGAAAAAALRSDEVQAVSTHFMRCVAERPIMMDEASLTRFAVGAGVPPETARGVVPAYVADLTLKRSPAPTSTPRAVSASTRGHSVAGANVARQSIELPQALELMGLCKLAFEEALQDPDEEDARNALAALRDAADQRALAASKSGRGGASSRPTSTDVASDSMSFSDSRADSRTAQQRLAARDNRQLAEAARHLAGVDGSTVSDIIEAGGNSNTRNGRSDAEVARAFLPRHASAEVIEAMRQLGAWFDGVSDDWVLPVASLTDHIAVPQAFLEQEGVGQEDWIGSEQFERLIACVRAQSASPPDAPLATRGSEATLGAGPSHGGSSFDMSSALPSPVTAAGSATLGSRALMRNQQQQQSALASNPTAAAVLSNNSRSSTYGVQNSAVRMSDLLAGLSAAESGSDRLLRESDDVDRRHAARLSGNAAAEPVIPRHASPYNTRPEPVPGPVTTTIAQRHALRNPRRSLGRGPSGQRTQPSSPKEAVSPTKRASEPAAAVGKRGSPTASKPAHMSKRPMSGGSRLPQTARAPLASSVPAHSAGQYQPGAGPVPHYRASSYSDLPMLRRSRPTSAAAAAARGKQPSQATSSDRGSPTRRDSSADLRPETPPKRPSGARHSPRPAVVYTEGAATPVIDFSRGGRSPSPNAPSNSPRAAAADGGSQGRDGQLRIVYVTDEHGNRHRHFLVPAPSAGASRAGSPAPPTVGRRQNRPTSRGAQTPAFDSSRDRTPTPAGLRQPNFADENTHPRPASPSPPVQPSSPHSPGAMVEEAPRHADDSELISDEVLVEEMRGRRAARFIQRKFKTWRARLKINNAYALQRIGRAFMMRRFVADIPVVIRETGERKVRTRRAIMLVMRLQAVGRGLLDRAAAGDKFSGFAENRALDDFVSSCGFSRIGRTTSAPASELFAKLLLRERRRALPSEGTRIRHEEEFAEELRGVDDDDELAHF